METECFSTDKGNVNNSHRPSCISDRKDQKESPIVAYHQNEESFSKEKGFQQIEGTFSQQLHCCNPDEVLAQIGFVPKVVEIRDDKWRKVIADSLEEGYLDNPGDWGQNGEADLLSGLPTGDTRCVNET